VLSARLTHRRLGDVAAYAQAVLLCFGAFFAGLLVSLASPFAGLATAPADGAGLDPLLRARIAPEEHDRAEQELFAAVLEPKRLPEEDRSSYTTS